MGVSRIEGVPPAFASSSPGNQYLAGQILVAHSAAGIPRHGYPLVAQAEVGVEAVAMGCALLRWDYLEGRSKWQAHCVNFD